MNTLLTSSFLGILWLSLLFLICFFCVHIVQIAKLFKGTEQKNKPEKTEPTPQKKPPEREKSAGEPIYYIVERKKRTKSSYGEPKRIDFKP